MSLLFVLLIFIAGMTASLVFGVSMLAPLALGLVLFSALAIRKGSSFRGLLRLMAGSLRDSMIVIRILLVIGCLIGLWRQSGTIACFVSFGVSHVPARGFLLAVFLLSAGMSNAIGTSFGVTATAGVILISIARAAGVDPVLTAGAVLSGVYVGDRGSPASSSANLVSVLTHTDMRQNIRVMLKTALVPFLACCALYGVISLKTPVTRISSEIPALLATEFDLTPLCLIPAAIMLILPFVGVKILPAMLVSLLSALALAMTVQKNSLADCLLCMVTGYQAKQPALDGMISGGGLVSMLEVCGILIISGTYGGIFRSVDLLSPVNNAIRKTAAKLGRYPAMILISLGVSGLFCNQTIGAIMASQLSGPLYSEEPEDRGQKMIDLEDSVILLAGLIPWCIASSVPLGMLAADARSLPFAFYLWLVPVWRLITLKRDRRR